MTDNVTQLEEDPITGMKFKPGNWQSFSWTWVWLSLGSFVLAQILFAQVAPRFETMHGNLLVEAILDIATYYLGGLSIGLASPKVRVLEPAVAAVISVFLVMSVGIWLPMRYLGFNLIKALLTSLLAFVLAWTGAVHGEKLTRQL